MVAMVVLSVHTSFPAQSTTPVDSNPASRRSSSVLGVQTQSDAKAQAKIGFRSLASEDACKLHISAQSAILGRVAFSRVVYSSCSG